MSHRVVWPRPGTYRDVITQYVRYVTRHYSSSATVVFDGYKRAGPSTKDCEHFRRQARGTCAELLFDEAMQEEAQTKFLTNGKNKERLIGMLEPALQHQGVAVFQAEADADALTVTTAVRVATERNVPVAVVSDDTDVLALLINLAGCTSLYQLSQAGKKEPKIYDISAIRTALKEVADLILFAHAISGTDTTSAPYKKDKRDPISKLKNNAKLRELAQVFYEATSSKEEVAAAGEAFFLAWYSLAAANLDEARYMAYLKEIAKKSVAKKIILELLPPTTAASIQHNFRVYHQVQAWLGRVLSAVDWGWKLSPTGFLSPIMTTLLPAPDKVLQSTACTCKTDCSNRNCGCVRVGDRCSPMCANCCSQACSNSMLDVPGDARTLEDEEEGDPDDPGQP